MNDNLETDKGILEPLGDQPQISSPPDLVQLNDLAADPGESHNLERMQPKVVEDFVNMLFKCYPPGANRARINEYQRRLAMPRGPTLKKFPQRVKQSYS